MASNLRMGGGHNLTGALRRFAQAKGANVAMIFALALLPMLASAGAALDLSRALLVRGRLSQALDAAGLAVGASVGLTQEQMESLAEAYFNANYPAHEIGVPGNLSVSVSGNVIDLSATAELDTTLMAILGIYTLDVGATTQITRETRGLEVVLVLDITGSMNDDGKLDAMKTAATDLIEILFGQEDNPPRLRVAVVPFAASVRLNPTEAVASDWIDTDGSASLARANFDGSLPNNYGYAMYTQYMVSTPWLGCVEARPNGLEETDTAPDVNDPDTLWVPMFSPDSPDNSWANPDYPNHYVGDGGSGTAIQRQIRSSKYSGRTANGAKSPHRMCAGSEIEPLTNSKTTLLDKIEGLIADGYTHIPLGILWGWRVLSPGEPYTQGSAYGDEDWEKAMVVLTDGDNTMPSSSNNAINKSDYTAFGFASQARMGPGIDTTGEMANELDNITARACTNVKDAGVRVYTILFQVDTPSTVDLFRNCATEPQLYFNSPTNEELQTVFQTIAQDLSNLRVSR